MTGPPSKIGALYRDLNHLEGDSYQAYQALLGKAYGERGYVIRFVHIQGSPGAFPASVVHLEMDDAALCLDRTSLTTTPRRIAAADYLLRAFSRAVHVHADQNRGAHGSGSFQPLELPPQVLQRNLVAFGHRTARISFHISLPGSPDNRVLSGPAVEMFKDELPAIISSLRAAAGTGDRMETHCNVVEDMMDLQERLSQYNLVAFIADGSILPRQSGDSQLPMQRGAIEFYAPDDLAVDVDLRHAGRIRGMGIARGISVVIGGAFHGKSTLLSALAKGVYPHIPGDGREQVVTHPNAMVICTEEGRAVTGIDISGFIDHLPFPQDMSRFSTQNASGSTSQAAAAVEAIQAGAKLLLIDEDTSAANFLARDDVMRRMVPEETITPLVDRVQELTRRWGVSTLMVMGGSSAYLGVADRVVAMQHYRPVDRTRLATSLNVPAPLEPPRSIAISDRRVLSAGNFDPCYHAKRFGKKMAVRIKPLRLQTGILEYGNQQVDLTHLDGIADPHQVMAIGYALLLAAGRFGSGPTAPSDLAAAIDALIADEGLDALLDASQSHLALARPRRLELAAAINRLRDLRIDFVDE